MMREIEPDIFLNTYIYHIDDPSSIALVHSNNLASIRAYAKSKGYDSTNGHNLVHYETGTYLSFERVGGAPPGALQPGSNLWYKTYDNDLDLNPSSIHRVAPDGSVQEFEGFHDFVWCNSEEEFRTVNHLIEKEYQEVSLDFLIFGEAELPSGEYRLALMQALV